MYYCINNLLRYDAMADTLQQFLDNQRELTSNNTDIYLKMEKSFFYDFSYGFLALKNVGKPIHSKEKIWKCLKLKLFEIISSYPEKFINDITFPYIRVLGSLHTLEARPELYQYIQSYGQSFIDLRLLADKWIGLSVPVCTIKEWADRRIFFNASDQQWRVRDIHIVLMDSFSVNMYEKGGGITDIHDHKIDDYFDGWEKRLKARAEKKGNTKRSYLQILNKSFTVRSIGLLIKNDKYSAQSPEAQQILFPKVVPNKPMNKKEWAYAIKLVMSHQLFERKIESVEEFGFKLLNQSWSNRYIADVAAMLLKIFKLYRTRFALKGIEIQDVLKSSLADQIRDIGSVGVYWKSFNKYISTDFKIDISRKSYNQYMECRKIEVLMKLNELPYAPSIEKIHKILTERGCTQATTRNFIKAIYSSKLWDNHFNKRGHDFQVLAASFISKISNVYAYKNSNVRANVEKIVKLTTTHLANEDISNLHKTLNKITSDPRKLRQRLKGIDPKTIKTLNDYAVGLTSIDNSRLQQAFKTADSNKWVVNEPLCQNTIKTLGLSIAHICEFVNHKIKYDTNKKLIQKDFKGLRINILPYNHLLGQLGHAVDGVCIAFGGGFHIEHLQDDCMNLIVFDDDQIYLWGLLVETDKDGYWFLNNLQGSLPSRHRKDLDRLVEVILETLQKLGTVYMYHLSFNALSLTENLDTSLDTFTTRQMRLDDSYGGDLHILPANVE